MINVELNSSILDISKQQPLVSEIDLEIGSNQFSFSDLLKGLQYKQKSLLSDGFDVNKDKLQSFNDKKEEQNNSLENFLLKDENKTSKTTLLDLLSIQNQDTSSQKDLKQYSPKELKQLVKNAKFLLKEKIQQSDGYKKSSIKELPKTLKGLSELAQKFDIKLSKITLEHVQIKSSKQNKVVQTSGRKDKPSTVFFRTSNEVHQNGIKLVKQDLSQNKGSLVQSKKSVSLESLLKVDTKRDKVVIEQKKDKKEIDKISVIQKPLKQEDEVVVPKKIVSEKNIIENKKNIVKIVKQHKISTKEQKSEIQYKQDNKSQLEISSIDFSSKDNLRTSKVKEVQYESLGSSQSSQEIKETKVSKLAMLLHGTKSSEIQENETLKQQIVSPSKLEPITLKEKINGLESLLSNTESKESLNREQVEKVDTVSFVKSEPLEVKIHEAKQMMKYLSQDVKTAIEDYKSPFTKIKVQLNPQKLGDVDLTVVKRGENLHINISSNTTAIHTLATNLNDLKLQLNNNGINNATFHFNGSQNGENAQQHHHHQRERAHKQYNYFENEEQNEEVLNSLEIIVPHYA